MISSLARIEANQRNAQLSTGPRTAAGKARSRLNAFQHGLAGAGDLLAPDEDGALVAERAEAFAAEFGASGVSGAFLARRAAILSVRMDRAQADAALGLALQAQAARAEVDAAHDGELDRLTEQLGQPAEAKTALFVLEQLPAGIDRLLDFWDRQEHLFRSEPWQGDLIQDVGLALGLTDAEVRDATPESLIERVAAERARLERVDAATRVEQAAKLDQNREAAARTARLKPSPQVVQVRRYDAAAERGFYQALRAIIGLRHDRERLARKGRTPTSPPASIQATDEPTAPVLLAPEANLVPLTVVSLPAAVAPMGSFRPGPAVAAVPIQAGARPADRDRDHADAKPRKRRDVRKVKSGRR